MREILLREIKKTLDQKYVNALFQRRFKKYFPRATKLLKVKVGLTKAFLGFRNLGLKYEIWLETGSGKQKIIIRGRARKRIDSPYDSPKRAFLVTKYLFGHGFDDLIARPIDYIPQQNLFLYENLSGKNFQEILAEGDLKTILKFIPRIANLLRKVHQVKLPPFWVRVNKKIFFIKDKKWEKADRRHSLHLAQKYYQPSYKFIKTILNQLKEIQDKNRCFFLNSRQFSFCHGDPHLGNFLKRGQKVGLIDFSESVASDPLDDVARFLVQTESMLQYYLPKRARQFWPQVKELFIKSYFGADKAASSQSFRLTFFEIMNLIQMLTNLVFTEKDPKNKKIIFKIYQKAINKRIIQLKH